MSFSRAACSVLPGVMYEQHVIAGEKNDGNVRLSPNNRPWRKLDEHIKK